ncbi:MAG: radical SAM protein [Candidatus Izemoplasmatales bacterium]|nr:radical SAM protein [Candidatus Izemoplasmatales bacterium]
MISTNNLQYLYGPIPSRRLGQSLGISPIPKKTCNYSCIYCQLGRTDKMTNTRQLFFPVEAILAELKHVISLRIPFDVISIVGEGEPTLYLGLGELISAIKTITEKPVAVITNGSLLFERQVQQELNLADIVLPTLDAVDETMFRRINRSHRQLRFNEVYQGLIDFSRQYPGHLWLEIMLMKGVNDEKETLLRFVEMLKKITYEKCYLNTPIRPPAEEGVTAVSHEQMIMAESILGGIAISEFARGGFSSGIDDDYEAILTIIKRHPMNQHEINGFLESRQAKDPQAIIDRLNHDNQVNRIHYKGYHTYRLK